MSLVPLAALTAVKIAAWEVVKEEMKMWEFAYWVGRLRRAATEAPVLLRVVWYTSVLICGALCVFLFLEKRIPRIEK